MSELQRQQNIIIKLNDDLQFVHRKLSKLKALLLLVDPAVSNVQMNETSVIQWTEFIKEFPDEGSKPG